MIKKTLQCLCLLGAWLTISPVFFFLSRRWNLLPKAPRWILMLVSPMFLLGYLVAFLALLFLTDKPFLERIKDPKELSEITSVDFPEFKVIKHHKGEVDFNGDFCDEIEAVFVVEPEETFYKSIEKQSEIKGIEWDYSSWNVHGDEYNYSLWCDNAFDVVSLEIKITKGKKDFHMKCEISK